MKFATKPPVILYFLGILIPIIIMIAPPTPILDGDSPYIVNEIVELDKGMCRYYGGLESKYPKINFFHPSIVLPRGMYNIGDTITLKSVTKPHTP